MPRRPAKIVRDIPLYLIPVIVRREVSSHGQELERLIVRKTRRHFYNVSIRTKPFKREIGDGAAGVRIRKVATGRPGTCDGLNIPGEGEKE